MGGGARGPRYAAGGKYKCYVTQWVGGVVGQRYAGAQFILSHRMTTRQNNIFPRCNSAVTRKLTS